MPDLDDQEYCAYAGVYQAYAWQQGYAHQIVHFRLPDENFMATRDFRAVTPFDLVKFFTVVADMDDGSIHYWHLVERDGDQFLAMACTEDESMNYLYGSFEADFLTAHSMLERLQQPKGDTA